MEDLNDTLPPNNLYCSYCNITLTNDARYTAHFKTKKHKRNINKARKNVRALGYAAPVEDSNNLTSLTPEEVLAYSDHKDTILETYVQKENDHEYIKWTYATACLAYCTADVAFNPTVDTFTVTINNIKVANNFGDAVLQVRFRELPGKKQFTSFSLIQFRNVNSSVDYAIKSATQGKFAIQDIVSEVEKLDQAYLIKTLLDFPSDDFQLKFSVVTTWTADPNLEYVSKIEFCPVCHKSKASHSSPCPGVLPYDEILIRGKPLKKKPLVMLNTSEYNENVLRFFYVPISSVTVDRDQFYHLYLYTSQRKLPDFPQGIEDMLNSRLGTRAPDGVADDFIDYITKWTEGRYGRYKLTKENILVKLGELLLEQYKCPMQRNPKFPNLSTEETSLWVRTVKSHDIVVLEKDADLSSLLEPWHKLAESILKVTLNATSSSFNISTQHVKNQLKQKDSVPFLWRYLIEELPKNNTTGSIGIPVEDVYIAMWKAGLMPLVLKPDSDQIENVVEVLEGLKTFGLTRRYFVVTSEVKRLRTFIRNLKVFANLDDLESETLLKLNIYVKETMLNYARDIDSTDPHLKHLLTARDFYYMSLEKCYLKKANSNDTKEELIKMILGKAVMERIKNSLDLHHVSEDVEMAGKLRGIDPALFKL